MKKYINELFRNEDKAIISAIVFIAVAVFILFSPSINGSFVYDDSFYITDNTYTQDFSSEGLQKIWSNYIFGNYNPLTISSLALDYKIFGEAPIGFHIINILFHILTTILILFFTHRFTGNYKIGIITAILFAVHPIHVESVSWISGRKDVLYSFFFMLSLLFYLNYLKEKTKTNYIFVILFFILSCLSKAVAVVLPIALILIDYYNHRKINKQSVREKVPFFIISIILGFIAIDAQTQEGALRIQEQFGLFDKILLSFYALYFYFEKLFVPLNLSANYPFPKLSGNTYPIIIYLSSVIIFIIGLVTYFSKKYTRKVMFAVLFFLVTIFPVLQIVAVGNAITADRFAYLPSFAFVLIITWGIYYLFVENNNNKLLWLRKEVVPIVIIWVIFLGFTTYNRAKVWQNEFTLFSDMIEKNHDVAFYYNNLGLAYFEKNKDYKRAKELFEKAISLKPNYSMAYNNLGNLYYEINQTGNASTSYLDAIKSDSNNAAAYNNFATILMERNEMNKAEEYLNKAIGIDKNYFDALNNYASVLIAKKQYGKAERILNRALSINRKSVKTYINFGLLYSEQNNQEKAEEYLLLALEKEPDNEEAKSFLAYVRNPRENNKSQSTDNKTQNLYENGVKLMNDGDLKKSEDIFKQVIKNNPNFIDAYTKLAVVQTSLEKYEDAIATFNDALHIQPGNTVMLKNMAVVYQKTGKMNKVVECYQKAARLGDNPAQDWLNLNGIKW
ncbi:MAG: tetratricopeptide repeat protein [bacterium]